MLFDLKDLLDALFKLHLGRIKNSYEAIHGKSLSDNLIDYENFDDLHDELQDLKTVRLLLILIKFPLGSCAN